MRWQGEIRIPLLLSHKSKNVTVRRSATSMVRRRAYRDSTSQHVQASPLPGFRFAVWSGRRLYRDLGSLHGQRSLLMWAHSDGKAEKVGRKPLQSPEAFVILGECSLCPWISKGFSVCIACGYGGIGRRARFRFWWETVQVRVLLSAFLPVLVHAFCHQRLLHVHHRTISPRCAVGWDISGN